MKSKTIFLTLLILCLLTSIAFAGTVQLPQTGQTKCYDSAGTEIACAGTGQDGEIQAGVAWPSPRFVNNGDGTITDSLTGLIWLQDTTTPTVEECAGGSKPDWNDALAYVACLNYLNYNDHNDWRLPNKNEIESLIIVGAPNMVGFLNGSGFSLQSNNYYWSSTTYSLIKYFAWVLSVDEDNRIDVGATPKYYDIWYHPMLVWPVRGDSSGPARISKTGQTKCYDSSGTEIDCTGTGQDGEIQAGISWPSPRFVNNGDGTVMDNLTGLMWTKTTDFPGINVNWQSALDYIAEMNIGTKENFGYNDWRLPNIKELESLTDAENYAPALQTGHPFTISSFGGQWSSSTVANNPTAAWMYSLYHGVGTGNGKVMGGALVWPVRGGQIGVGNLEISPASHDFGNLDINSCSASQIFTLQNTGNADLQISDITLSDTNFQLDMNGGLFPCTFNNLIYKPGQFCTVTVSFCPTRGAINANLTVTSNDPDSPILDVPIMGTGYILADSFGYPLDTASWRVSQYFGNLYSEERGYHLGEDWVKKVGSSYDQDVFAIANGEVVHSEVGGGCWLNVIVIRHTLPDGKEIESLYGHLKSRNYEVGDIVKKGDLIGRIGWPDCGGPHLHLEVRDYICPDWDNNHCRDDGYSSTRKPKGWLDPSYFIAPPDLTGQWTSLAVKQVTTTSGTQWIVYGNLKVANQGIGDARNFVIKFYFVPSNGGSPQLLEQKSYTGLLKGAVNTISFKRQYSTNPSGTGSIRVVIDANNAVTESHEANNEAVKGIP